MVPPLVVSATVIRHTVDQLTQPSTAALFDFLTISADQDGLPFVEGILEIAAAVEACFAGCDPLEEERRRGLPDELFGPGGSGGGPGGRCHASLVTVRRSIEPQMKALVGEAEASLS